MFGVNADDQHHTESEIFLDPVDPIVNKYSKNEIEIAISQELEITQSNIKRIPTNLEAFTDSITVDEDKSVTQENVDEDINAQSLLVSFDLFENRKKSMIKIIKRLLYLVENITGRSNKKMIVESIMTSLIGYVDVLHGPSFTSFIPVLKKKFHTFIICEKMRELIPLYNLLFTDKIYDHIELPLSENSISKNEIDKLIEQYHTDINDSINKKINLRVLCKYEEDEIVGAKDTEGKWWMSKILRVFKHLEHNMYYVEFLGWGQKFNEFIVDSFRIAKFNPRKHIYYRPAWIRNRYIPDDESDQINKTEINIKDE
jgi:hypothetical protein